MINLIKKLFEWQIKLSFGFDKWLPAEMSVYGTKIINVETVPQRLNFNQKIYDIGGGKRPNISLENKNKYNLHITVLDIDENELKNAPRNVYDGTLCADITTKRGNNDGDLVICRSVMEHVKNTALALEGIASFLKPGGEAVIFVPCGNAWFTLLNRVMPEKFKVRMLNYFFPDKKDIIGFKAHYDRCTPLEMKRNARSAGFEIVETRLFYASNYFTPFLPLHIIWRLYQLIIKFLKAENLCETFILVLRKL